MKKNQIINCDVVECKFCDINQLNCNLKEIKISFNNNSKKDKEHTMCESYKSR